MEPAKATIIIQNVMIGIGLILATILLIYLAKNEALLNVNQFLSPAPQVRLFWATKENCEAVTSTYRMVPDSADPVEFAIKELVKGPNERELKEGFVGSVNTKSIIKSLTITNGIAILDFNESFKDGVAGSCRVTAIKSSVENTLLQFSGIKKVSLSVNGISDGILEP